MTPMDHRYLVSTTSTSLLTLAALMLAVPMFCQEPATYSAAVSTAPAERGSQPSGDGLGLQVRYTGKLFGYYRIEADEDLDSSSPKLSAVLRFLESPANANHPDDSLLLGMGDNFAPEYGANMQQEVSRGGSNCYVRAPAPPDPKYAPMTADQFFLDLYEDHYKSSTRKPPLADCDNVTRFLMRAGYRAVVPGREDFLYGGTWLRRMALLLAGASEKDNKDNPFFPADDQNNSTPRPYRIDPINNFKGKLHILAANVRVTIADPSKSGKSNGPAFCPLLFARNLADQNHACVKPGGTYTAEMDWFSRLERTLDARFSLDAAPSGNSHGIENSVTRQAGASAGFRKRLVINQFAILQTLFTSYACQGGLADKVKIKEFTGESSYQAVETTNTLVINKKVKVKLDLDSLAAELANDAQSSLQCSAAGFGSLSEPTNAITGPDATTKLRDLAGAVLKAAQDATNPEGPQGLILLPQDQLREERDLFLNLIYIEQKDVGYTIAELPSGKHVLIVGVIGQETAQEISKLNRRVFPELAEDGQSCPPAAATGNAGNSQERQKGGDGKPPSPVCKSKADLTDAMAHAFRSPEDKDAFPITFGDPHLALSAILAAAWTAHARSPDLFDTVVVMAQMPPAEAEELAARVREDMTVLFPDQAKRPSIDLMLSESQDGHETPSMAQFIAPDSTTPVLVPPDGRDGREPDAAVPISIATIGPAANPPPQSPLANLRLTRLFVNTSYLEESPGTNPAGSAPTRESHKDSASSLLEARLHEANGGASDLDTLWNSCLATGSNGHRYQDSSCQDNVLMQYLLGQIQHSSNADVAMLERRDYFFGWLGSEYSNDRGCDEWQASARDHTPSLIVPGSNPHHLKDFASYCKLRAALDRVLWKGDLVERVMIDGTTLNALMTAAQQQNDVEQSLLARDIHQAWLTTFGIVTTPGTNLVIASPTTDRFYVPESPACPTSGAATNTGNYCVDGAPVVADHAYWIATSDHLAEDTDIYQNISGLLKDNGNYAQATEKYISGELAEEILSHRQDEAQTKPGDVPQGEVYEKDTAEGKNPSAESSLLNLEQSHQSRSLAQLDFSKLVAGFTFFHPNLSDNQLASDLSGVANTQATTPHSQELDLETASRLVFSMPQYRQQNADLFAKYFTFGLQNDTEYDRKVLGNLTGNPETVTYSLNGETAGGFFQIPADHWIAPHPHAFIVFAPFQYQRQMTGAYLNFAYLSAAGVTNTQQQLSVHAPYVWGFTQRIGFRYQMDAKTKWGPDVGSYGEVGPEYANQNNILSALLMPQISSTAVCNFVATQSIQTCVKNAYKTAGIALNGSSVFVPVPETLHAGGLYWTMHLQKQLAAPKKSSVTFDTQGDSFLLPGATLTTQERYGITTNLAFNLSIFGNITLSPTYTSFYFENQGSPSERTGVIAPAYTVVLKWYFVRDSGVPFRRQSLFSGPATASQTTTSKLK